MIPADAALVFALAVLVITVPPALIGIVTGYRGGYRGRGLMASAGRAWAILVQVIIFGSLAIILGLGAISFVRGEPSAAFDRIVPALALGSIFACLFGAPAALGSAALAYNFGAQHRARDAIARGASPPPLPETIDRDQ